MTNTDCKRVQLLGLGVSLYFSLYKVYTRMSEYSIKIVQPVNGIRLPKLKWQLLLGVFSYMFFVYSIYYLITPCKIIQVI
jgi:hypothetical protein